MMRAKADNGYRIEAALAYIPAVLSCNERARIGTVLKKVPGDELLADLDGTAGKPHESAVK